MKQKEMRQREKQWHNDKTNYIKNYIKCKYSKLLHTNEFHSKSAFVSPIFS